MASPTTSQDLRNLLGKVVGRDAVLTQPGELLTYESDALTAYRATPAAVVFVGNPRELRQVVTALHTAKIPFVARGAGTGLSGGAVADDGVIVALSRMNRILWIDAENRRAKVQPGVINSQLSTAVAPHGLMYAPDPSSQTACTLGGNVAENAGGPHCLKYGVTTNHVLGLTVVAPDGEVLELPGPGKPGYDLVGLFVGSEGTLGICSEIEVQIVPLPNAIETTLAHFDDIGEASRAVSAIIAAGILPAALEMIDQNTIKAVEASVFAAGFPTDVAASLIVELDGALPGLAEQASEVEALLKAHGAREVARAKDEEDRLRFWKARKSAFGAMGRVGSDLLVQDATVPRSRIPDMLERVYETARKYDLMITNVFHAGDGNLHPNIPYDRREPGVMERIRTASREIMDACVAAGGTITGEHGVGADKRHYMSLVYSEDDLETMRWVKEVFDPEGLCNPDKVLPDMARRSDAVRASAGSQKKDIAATIESELGAECLEGVPAFSIDGEAAKASAAPSSVEEIAELMKLASANGWTVLPVGHGTWTSNGNAMRRVDLAVSTQRLNAPVEHCPEDLLATVQAGTTLAELNAALGDADQWWPLDPLGGGTLGATVAAAADGPLAASYGVPRDLVLGLTLVRADGRVVKAGGRVVKNVAGYDMVKLYTGSWGTLGVIVEANLRLHALPQAEVTRLFSADQSDELVEFAAALCTGEQLAPSAAEIVSPPVARVLGIDTDRWQLAVRWLGHRLAVDDAVNGAEARLNGGVAEGERKRGFWKSLTQIEESLEPVLTVRVDVPFAKTAELVRRATPFVAGETPAVVASPLSGRSWIFVSSDAYDEAADERVWGLRIDDLWEVADSRGGSVRIDRAPDELRRTIDPWGDAGAAQRLHAGLKARFDPNSILKPGFFVGGL
jgi:glycolate oxidase subunit GlcD